MHLPVRSHRSACDQRIEIVSGSSAAVAAAVVVGVVADEARLSRLGRATSRLASCRLIALDWAVVMMMAAW